MCRRSICERNLAPALVVERCNVPCRCLAEVIVLAYIYIIECKSTPCRKPRLVCRDDFRRAVGVCNTQVHTELRTTAPRSLVKVPRCLRLIVVPTVSKYNAQRIPSLNKQRSNIEREIHCATVKARIDRLKEVSGSRFAINGQLKKSAAGDVRSCCFYGFTQGKCLTKIRSWPKFTVAAVAHPRTLPMTFAHHARLKCSLRLANLNSISRERLQGFAFIVDKHRTWRSVVSEDNLSFAVLDYHSKGSLVLCQAPTETWIRVIYANRSFQMVYSQMCLRMSRHRHK